MLMLSALPPFPAAHVVIAIVVIITTIAIWSKVNAAAKTVKRTPGTRSIGSWELLQLQHANLLGYKHLAVYIKNACILPEHKRAVKMLLYIRTLGIAHIRGYASRAPIFQMMQSLTIKRTIWRYLDVAKPVALVVEIVAPATSNFGSGYTVTNMLAGKKIWKTDYMPGHEFHSVVVSVAAGSRVTSFDVASYWSRSECQMCVEEVAADGTVGVTLVAWNNYGTFSGVGFKPSNYTPATIAVKTTATRFKVSVRHTFSYSDAGVAVFRATGVAP